jgi:hypothetical protein
LWPVVVVADTMAFKVEVAVQVVILLDQQH